MPLGPAEDSYTMRGLATAPAFSTDDFPMNGKPLGIALLGCGTVGGGVAKLLLEQGQRLAARAGRPLQLRTVVVRDPALPRSVPLPGNLLTTRLTDVLEDES